MRQPKLCNSNELSFIYFHGKKQLPIKFLQKYLEKGGIQYVVLVEHGEDYLTQMAPSSSHGQAVAQAFYDFCGPARIGKSVTICCYL